MQGTLRTPRLRHGGPRRARSETVIGGLLAALALTTGACSSGSSKHAVPPSPTAASPTTTTAIATTTSSSSTTTTTPVVTTTTTPLHVVDLTGCPADDSSAELTRLNTGPLVAGDLVPIDALNVRICTYGRAGKAPGPLGISWLALSAAAAFRTETNGLTSTTEPAMTCTGATKQSASYLLTFAVDTQTVNLYAGGCPPTVSNGTLTVPATAQWYRELTRLASHAGLAPQAP